VSTTPSIQVYHRFPLHQQPPASSGAPPLGSALVALTDLATTIKTMAVRGFISRHTAHLLHQQVEAVAGAPMAPITASATTAMVFIELSSLVNAE
jgi:hypothetical protein